MIYKEYPHDLGTPHITPWLSSWVCGGRSTSWKYVSSEPAIGGFNESGESGWDADLSIQPRPPPCLQGTDEKQHGFEPFEPLKIHRFHISTTPCNMHMLIRIDHHVPQWSFRPVWRCMKMSCTLNTIECKSTPHITALRTAQTRARLAGASEHRALDKVAVSQQNQGAENRQRSSVNPQRILFFFPEIFQRYPEVSAIIRYRSPTKVGLYLRIWMCSLLRSAD